MIKRTYFTRCFIFTGETQTSAPAGAPKKRKSIGLLLDTQPYKQFHQKINRLQENEQGGVEESGAPYHRYHARLPENIRCTVVL